eukprot:INCI14357.1.p1 GENE.INCI14357.1~~INCI14357.1.p1  ORF type:complete len:370 (-),score=41.70 INCI14357.1:323-1432(-)
MMMMAARRLWRRRAQCSAAFLCATATATATATAALASLTVNADSSADDIVAGSAPDAQAESRADTPRGDSATAVTLSTTSTATPSLSASTSTTRPTRRARRVLVVGGPGSGKHTLCAALSAGMEPTNLFFAGTLHFGCVPEQLAPGLLVAGVASGRGRRKLRAEWFLQPSKQLRRLGSLLTPDVATAVAAGARNVPMFPVTGATSPQLQSVRISNTSDRDHAGIDSLSLRLLGPSHMFRHNGWLLALDLSSPLLDKSRTGVGDSVLERVPDECLETLFGSPSGLVPDLIVVLRCKRRVLQSRMAARRVHVPSERHLHAILDADVVFSTVHDDDIVALPDDQDANERSARIDRYAGNIGRFLRLIRRVHG